MNEQDKNSRFYPPKKQGKDNTAKNKPAASTRLYVSENSSRFYPPTKSSKNASTENQKSGSAKSSSASSNTKKTADRQSTLKNTAKPATHTPPAKGTRIAMPLDENRSYKPSDERKKVEGNASDSVSHKDTNNKIQSSKKTDKKTLPGKLNIESSPSPQEINTVLRNTASKTSTVSNRKNAKSKQTHYKKPAPKLTEAQYELSQKRRYIISLTAACIGVIICSTLLFLYVFGIRKITVVGATRYESDYIISLTGVTRGDNLLFVNANELIDNINDDPYMSAEIRKNYPDELVVIITENEERAVIKSVNGSAIIDAFGTVLDIRADNNTDDSGLLSVLGMSSTGLKVGSHIDDTVDYRAHALLKLIDAIDRCGLTAMITQIDIENPFGIYMKTKDGINVYIGNDENIEEKLLGLEDICKKIIEMGYGSGELNVSNPDDPSYMPDNSEIPEPTVEPSYPMETNQTGTPENPDMQTTESPYTQEPG